MIMQSARFRFAYVMYMVLPMKGMLRFGRPLVFYFSTYTHEGFTNHPKIYRARMLKCCCIQPLQNTLDKTKTISSRINWGWCSILIRVKRKWNLNLKVWMCLPWHSCSGAYDALLCRWLPCACMALSNISGLHQLNDRSKAQLSAVALQMSPDTGICPREA